MSLAERSSGLRIRWRRRTRRWHDVLDRRVALDRWYPHVPIALAMLPLGLLLVDAAARTTLGVGVASVEVARIERAASALRQRPIIEIALGFSLFAMSIGIALRSRLAWLWSVGTLTGAVALRLPPESAEVPLALYLAGLLFLLIVYRSSFARSSVATSLGFASVALTSFLVWAALGALRLGDQFEPPLRDLLTALYFVVVTISSVGYGDIVARGLDARLFVMLMIVIGVIVLATSLSAILLPLIGGRVRELLGGRQPVDRTNHFVIVGKSPLARNAATELEKRKQRVTLVLDRAPEEDFYKNRDVVVGDATDLAVLRTAGTPEAKGVLALSTDDATNGFVVLGVNELQATVATVAALNDPTNRFRLDRTQPSMVLSLQALGGELLAMALTGEHVDVDMLSRVLQVHGTESEKTAK